MGQKWNDIHPPPKRWILASDKYNELRITPLKLAAAVGVHDEIHFVSLTWSVQDETGCGTAACLRHRRQCSGGESCHRDSHIQNIKGLTSPVSLRETRNEIMNWKFTTEHKWWLLKWWQNVNDSYKTSLEQKWQSRQTNVLTHSCYSVAQMTSFELVYKTTRCCSPRLL